MLIKITTLICIISTIIMFGIMHYVYLYRYLFIYTLYIVRIRYHIQ